MQQRATLALLLCALVGGAAATKGPLISGIREAKQAAISGIREHHEAKISGLRTKFFSKHAWLVPEAPAGSGAPGTTLTPTVTPAECLSAAGLAPALSDRSLQATVFAPTDEAFATALEALDVTPAQLLAQPELLQAILKYHVVPGQALTSSQLKTAQELPTLLAADLEAAAEAEPTASWMHKGKEAEEEPEDGVLSIAIQQVYGLHPKSASRRINVVGSLSSAEVVVPDINAGCPAVVHVIDNVLLPDLAEEEAEVEVEGQEASGMFGSLLKLWGGM
ncbi:hypothetical protein CHLNCDRAFT_138882 [Chlorella variabilis]|uniref:FAS1 domain-containing protein n=1 Tax=Chlorella variabilis TaxID=554065 RepID=E1ZNU9_CHLVA|nr:hypothetical protein CHLNCDRAFT_138882 [Chlorella variabilis]EFN52408.1 hypothetical protein CHLNCDRAFT_138882 [Chlorella variabilis]|eukprot:XP_005844510.1 hypothetical protein CHLNCDRAFT_138882 [Chlorella variabilis]